MRQAGASSAPLTALLSAWVPALVLASALMSACAPSAGPDAKEGLSLVELFPAADSTWQIRSLDFGTPEARSHLRGGWGYDHKTGLRTAVWALGRQASVEVYLDTPRDLGLYLDAQRRNFGGALEQTVTVSVNDHVIGTIEPPRDFGDPQTLEAPAAVWTEGVNVITFDHATTAVPSLFTDRKQGAPLAASWNGLALMGIGSSEAPTATPGSEEQASRLRLPYGSQVTFYLRLEPGAELVLPEVRGPGSFGTPGRLMVRLEAGAGGPAMQWRVDSDDGPTRLPLTEQAGLFRLTLRSKAREAGRIGKRGLTLVDPRVVNPPASASAPVPATEIATGTKVSGPKARPNILLYVIDTLRADHVGAYGYDRDTTPNLDALAADGILFENARAQSSWTRPSVTSILTGLYPQRHGTNGQDDRLADEVQVLPELLRQSGYETAAVITNGIVSQPYGFDRGFDAFRYLEEKPQSPAIHQGADALHREALAWLASRDRERPFFLYLHATDPHAPYRAPESWRSRFAPGVDPDLGDLDHLKELEWNPAARSADTEAGLRSLFDAEIAFFDDEFGRLMDALRESDQYDDTLVVVVADHGEEFGEHGRWQHTMTLNEEQLRIPLLFKLPGSRGAGTRIESMVEQVDIAPSLLAAAVDETRESDMQGRNILPWLDASERVPNDRRPSWAILACQPEQRWVESVMVGSRKLIRYRAYDRPRPGMELFDLLSDPTEHTNLAEEHSIEAGYLLTRLRLAGGLWQGKKVQRAKIDAELEKSLRAVGYLD